MAIAEIFPSPGSGGSGAPAALAEDDAQAVDPLEQLRIWADEPNVAFELDESEAN